MAQALPMNKRVKECSVCKNEFVSKAMNSLYCSTKCRKDARNRKKVERRLKVKQESALEKIDKNQAYLSIPEIVSLFNVSKNTIYRRIKRGEIPAINLGERQIRVEREIVQEMFTSKPEPIPKVHKPQKKLYSLEPEDCYTIGEIAKLFDISERTVYVHIRKYSIPTRQIGNYVYVPKCDIDELYK